jgi:phage terminase large subunit-like protein
MIPTWTTACPDWEQRIVNKQSLVPCPPLYPDEAEAALKVFKALPIVDLPSVDDGFGGRRPPTFGEVCRPWVFDFVGAIFGAFDAETGDQRINEFFELISKKNIKSTMAAGIMVTALVRNWRLKNELTIIAPTVKVANNSADPAMAMVQWHPELATILRPVPHLRMIEHRTTKAELKILAADSETVSGSKAGIVLIEEFWLFGKMAKAQSMLREAVGGLASRPEGFVIKLTTQSDEPPAGVFAADLDRFRKIRDGKIIAPRSMGILYEFPAAMLKSGDYKKPEHFYVTNPNLGASVGVDFLLTELDKALTSGPKEIADFYAKHLNVEIGIGLRSDGWAGAHVWLRGVDETITLESLLQRCEVVAVGIDGGGLDDLLGVGVVGREKGTKTWLSWAKAFITPEGLDRRKANRSSYDDFEKDGDLVYVETLKSDVSQLVDVVRKVKDSGLLYKVGVDPAGLGIIVDALADIEVTEENENLIGVRQGIALMGAIKAVERRVADRTFLHPGQRLMNWCAGNAIVQPTPTGMRIVRDASGFGKIDPLMATLDAAALMAENPEANVSVFDQMTDDVQTQTGAAQQQSGGIDYTILSDPTHPKFAEMRDKFNASLAADDEEF